MNMTLVVHVCDDCRIWFDIESKARAHYIARGHNVYPFEIGTLLEQAQK